jgi:hypothetical protein
MIGDWCLGMEKAGWEPRFHGDGSILSDHAPTSRSPGSSQSACLDQGVYQTITNVGSRSFTNVAMAGVDSKHGLTEKEYTDDAAHNAASRGQTATDQYVFFWKPVIINR